MSIPLCYGWTNTNRTRRGGSNGPRHNPLPRLWRLNCSTLRIDTIFLNCVPSTIHKKVSRCRYTAVGSWQHPPVYQLQIGRCTLAAMHSTSGKVCSRPSFPHSAPKGANWPVESRALQQHSWIKAAINLLPPLKPLLTIGALPLVLKMMRSRFPSAVDDHPHAQGRHI